MIEIVSPGNKNSRHAVSKFVEKAIEMLDAGVHLLIADLLPVGSCNPSGMHGAIWKEGAGEHYGTNPSKPLTLASYIEGGVFEAYVEPTAVGATLIEMPLVLDPDSYVNVPLEMTYQSAWEAVPAGWRKVLEAGTAAR